MFSAAVDKESSSSYILGIPPVTQSEKESLYHDRKHRTAQIQDGPNSGKNRLLTTATAAPHFSQQQQQQQQEQQPRKSSSNDLASKDSGISGSSDSPLSCAATPVRAQRYVKP